MKRAPTLTVAAIMLNEQPNVADWLDSAGFADERLIVDGGSTDRTVEIAAGRNARVLSRPFDCFASQRNHALEHARGDWVLFVDADERVPPELAREVRQYLAHPRHAACRVHCRSHVFGKPFRFGGTQDDWPIRLIRRGTARYQGMVHETVATRNPVGRLNAALSHLTIPDLPTFLTKMHRYTTLEAMDRVSAGIAPKRRDLWSRPVWESARRLIAKGGFLDGPRGIAFGILSGISEWVLARRHRDLWRARQQSLTAFHGGSA